MRRSFIALSLLIVFITKSVDSVDKSKFRRCDQTRFCKAFREKKRDFHFDALKSTLQLSTDHVNFELTDKTSASNLFARIFFYKTGACRLKIVEKTPLHGRWQPEDIIEEESLEPATFRQVKSGDPSIPKEVGAFDQANQLGFFIEEKGAFYLLTLSPFSLDLFVKGKPGISVNKRGLFHFEQHRLRLDTKAEGAADQGDDKDIHNGKKIVDYGEDGLAIYEDGTVQEKGDALKKTEAPASEGVWTEHFGSHTDTKPLGPASVGMDISFPGSNHVYGIPEHASDLKLKTTFGSGAAYSEPYRLYNLDVFEYELDEPMTLYGSIPFMLSHKLDTTVGAFWFNPTETWVDIEENAQTHWLSESGNIDLFLLPGPTPAEVFYQYGKITGFNALPPVFSIAYHQCRWNYKDEDDVAKVNSGFETHNIPYDVLWLDIEHTDGKRYFTWDKFAFPNPKEMVQNISSFGRKMVTIIDPHIKRDDGYFIHKEATEKGVYVKDKDGKDFDGWCWPGSSSYVDFTDPRAREWWADQFSLEKYEGSTPDLFTWNDMNEPSVFNGPEVSMQKDCKNLKGIEHREWHNLYGLYMQRATAEGQIKRNANHNIRPFVLSRAFFAGSQKYGAIWTGDNAAKWEHLDYATKMLLSMGIAGLPFVGADVGGFFGNPDAELTTRWYQAAAYQPFFRGHAHHDSKRREPWIFDEPHTSRIRNAITTRYALLPFWYTRFHEAETTGMPVMRPLWVHYGSDPNTFAIDNQFLGGADLLVKPIVGPGIESTEVYFPGTNKDLWYDISDFKIYHGGERRTIAAPMEKIPVFQRGGSIIPRKMRIRRSSKLMFHDPYTLCIALDSNKQASGDIYLDDETTFNYKKGYYRRRIFRFDGTSLVSSSGAPAKLYTPENTVERIVIVGLGRQPSGITVEGEKKEILLFYYDQNADVLVIRKPGVRIAYDWKITFAV